MFLDNDHLELIARCADSAIADLSDQDMELAVTILNLGEFVPPANEGDRRRRLDEIRKAWREQVTVLGSLRSSFLDLIGGDANLPAFRHVVENLGAIRSLFMLDGLADLLLQAQEPLSEDEEPSEDYPRSAVQILHLGYHDMIEACSSGRAAKLSDGDIEQILAILSLDGAAAATGESNRAQRVEMIRAAIKEQNRVMLRVGRVFVGMQRYKPLHAAYSYALENLGAIRSIWMLNLFMALVTI